MPEVFKQAYASAYDSLYADKNYEREVDLLEELLALHRAEEITSVLDLGCGTGTHASILARRGRDVVGVDRSAAMLALAKEKADRKASNPEFHLGDIRHIRIGRYFDAVLMMFAVFSYQLTDQDVASTLGTARSHLLKSGLFLFDLWYGPAVLKLGPGHRSKDLGTPLGPVRRTASGSLQPTGNICRVEIRLEGLPAGEPIDTEVHHMRYFFKDELHPLLTFHGFELVDMRSFPDIERKPNDSSWNALVIARAI